MTTSLPRYPGIPEVINGNGAVAHVMKHVCGGMIGYPITPSTEISELFEAARAEGQLNVWGAHPFFVEAEGEHSGQSGALGAALTGGNYVSNASSSQGILYGIESHYVTAGKKVGGFVLHVAARVVSKHSLNVMAGHDDVYALLPAGYTILFGSSPQEAADLAAISYRIAGLTLIPVANAMDGFATSHVMSEAVLPEPALLREYLPDPAGRIACPTIAQEILFGAKGRMFQLGQYLDRHAEDFEADDLAALRAHLASMADDVEADEAAELAGETMVWVPAELRGQWRRQWLGAERRGTRQTVPALVDPHNPGLTGPVQNQPDFQAGSADHRAHFAADVPALARAALAEYGQLTGRVYSPVMAYDCDDADFIMVGLGSITDDVRAVVPHLRSQGIKAGVVSVKLLQPFPEAEFVQALGGAKAVMVLERSDDTALTRLVCQALFRAQAGQVKDPDGESVGPARPPRVTSAIFGLGGHDVQPRHLVAAFKAMAAGDGADVVYLGSQFFEAAPPAGLADVQDRLRQAYPQTAAMALATEDNPELLPPGSLRIRFHSVGGYGTVATGKLLTDILAGLLSMHSKSAPKYGSEKSGAATNFYITLSPEPVLLTNAELEDVDVVISPDHQVFVHTNPLKGLARGGTFIMQSDKEPLEVWRSLPAHARRTIRQRGVKFLAVDAFAVAKKHAPSPELETRMMGIAFIGAMIRHVEAVSGGGAEADIEAKVRQQIEYKFGRKGPAVVEGNMAVIKDGMTATRPVEYDSPAFVEAEKHPAARSARTVALSAAMCPAVSQSRSSALFDPDYYEDLAARPFREGSIAEAPVLPGAGLFMPIGSGALKDKGVFRRNAPIFNPDVCTGCLECALACPDTAIPNQVHEIVDLLQDGVRAAGLAPGRAEALAPHVYAWADSIRQAYRADPALKDLPEAARRAAAELGEKSVLRVLDQVAAALAEFPTARTRPFFDSVETSEPGRGGLFSAVVDPWKCTGCLQCVDVCGPAALVAVDQTAATADTLETRFERLTTLQGTPKRFTQGAAEPDGDIKRLLLDHDTYYAMTGGHGACRGCGEVTALRLLTTLSHAVGDARRQTHVAELEQLLAELAAKAEAVQAASAAGGAQAKADAEARAERIAGLIRTLEARLYLYEGGPTGRGPATTVVANSTGCSSVYASTMPFTPYTDPWVNSLFQDAQPLAAGIWEGLISGLVPEVQALRAARAELADAFDPAKDPKRLATISWRDFTPEEFGLAPAMMTVSGDGAAFDIGFGAMSRVLAAGTPIKAIVLNTGSYSNTGGQSSTASYTGQDADLARFGRVHDGKREARKELGLLASFHPRVFACSVSTALHAHFLATALSMLEYHDGAALMEVYTPCSTENGIAEDLSNARSRLAVESRMAPLFVHDPRRGASLPERFSLDGNPEPGGLWTTRTLQHLDDAGQLALLQTPITPAEFAYGEVRFAKQFRRLAPEEVDDAVPIAEYVELAAADRSGKTPFIWATDRKRRLIRVACRPGVVALVEDRRHYWQTLQFLAGQTGAALSAAHRQEIADLTARYEAAVESRESSLDQIAAAMAELASSSQATPAGLDFGFGAAFAGGGGPAGGPGGAPAASGGAGGPAGDRPIWLDPADVPTCNDCGTCYQELPQLFEKTTIVVDGEARVVAQMIDGALDSLDVTPELTKRMGRVKANCDAEIIR